MTANNPLKLLSACMLCTVLSACGDLFGAGGASLEGTGNGKPPAPGMGNAGDDKNTGKEPDDKFKLELILSAPVVDSCNLVIRELQFIDPKLNKAVLEKSVIRVNFTQEGEVPVAVQLTLENANSTSVEIEYPRCDVPLMLENAARDFQFFPAKECDGIKTETLAPDEIRSYRLNYNLKTLMDANWEVHSKMKLTVTDPVDTVCEPLLLPIQLKEIGADMGAGWIGRPDMMLPDE